MCCKDLTCPQRDDRDQDETTLMATAMVTRKAVHPVDTMIFGLAPSLPLVHTELEAGSERIVPL